MKENLSSRCRHTELSVFQHSPLCNQIGKIIAFIANNNEITYWISIWKNKTNKPKHLTSFYIKHKKLELNTKPKIEVKITMFLEVNIQDSFGTKYYANIC